MSGKIQESHPWYEHITTEAGMRLVCDDGLRDAAWIIVARLRSRGLDEAEIAAAVVTEFDLPTGVPITASQHFAAADAFSTGAIVAADAAKGVAADPDAASG